MKASALPRYLIGSRQAILEVAASRGLLLVGAMFVLSAGFAREYDGEDLVHEPWHLFRPLGASLITGTTLFLIVHLAALLKRGKCEGTPPSFIRSWGLFLGLFWLTAPMAWLYAIPYERFMSPVDAIRVNLWTLAIVAALRVVLMIRVISVLYGIGFVSSFFLVMLFADALAFIVVTLIPTPVIDVMGGIRHSERDALIASFTFNVTVLSFISAPVWIIGALVATGVLKPKWPDLSVTADTVRSRGMLILAAVSIVAFVPLMLMSQPEQINRREAESLLKQGKVADALAIMSDRSQDDYPPHWNPPPKLGYRESSPSLEAVRDAMSAQRPSDWVAAIYVAKIDRRLRRDIARFWAHASWTEIVETLTEYGGLDEIDPEHGVTAQFLLDFQSSLDEADREALKQIVQFASPSD